MSIRIDTNVLRTLLLDLLASPEAEQPVAPTATEETPVSNAPHTLPAFSYKGVDVPVLEIAPDQGQVASSASVRSPYNKVRFRAGLEIFPTDATMGQLGEFHRWVLENLADDVQPEQPTQEPEAASFQERVEIATQAVAPEDIFAPVNTQDMLEKAGKVERVAYTNSKGVTRYGTPKQVEAWKAGGKRLSAHVKAKQPKQLTLAPEKQASALSPEVAEALLTLVNTGVLQQ